MPRFRHPFRNPESLTAASLPRAAVLVSARAPKAALALILLIVIASSGLGAMAPPATADTGPVAAPEWEPARDAARHVVSEDTKTLAAEQGITLDEASTRRRVEAAAAVLQSRIAEQQSDTFAGLWITTNNPPLVNVAFVESAFHNVERLREQFPFPELLRPRAARHSVEALRSLQGRMINERTAVALGRAPVDLPVAILATSGHYDLYIDVQRNAIITRVQGSATALSEAFTSRYGTDRVLVEEGILEPAACTRSDCRYSMRGGLRLTKGSDPGYCSSAFSAFSAFNDGGSFVLSAGHCSFVNRYNGGSHYGGVDLEDVYGWIDAERIRRTNAAWGNVGRVWVSSSDQRAVQNCVNWNDIVVGMYVGKSAVRTGATYGYIFSKDASPSYIPNGARFLAADVCVDSGDSGGAVFSNTTAVGIVSGKTRDYSCGDSNYYSVHGAVSYAQGAMGVYLQAG